MPSSEVLPLLGQGDEGRQDKHPQYQSVGDTEEEQSITEMTHHDSWGHSHSLSHSQSNGYVPGYGSSGQGSRCSRCCASTSSTVGSLRKTGILKNIKILFLFSATVLCSVVFVTVPEMDILTHQLSVSIFTSHTLNVTGVTPKTPIVNIFVRGSLLLSNPDRDTQNISLRVTNPTTGTVKEYKLAVASYDQLTTFAETTKSLRFDFAGEDVSAHLTLHVASTTVHSTPLSLATMALTTEIYNEVIYAAVILVGVYVLIVFELVHRTLAAILGALAALTVLASLNQRSTLEEVVGWMDYETLTLLFGMMILVSIFVESGFFDWAAVKTYKLAKGKTWPLITMLCLFGAVISAFLDNVTTILLLTPVTIRLCEALELDPKHVLIAEVMFSNIGGAMTAIGDPPNVILVSNKHIQHASNNSINFASFTLHMSVGGIFVLLASYGLLRLLYRRKELLKSADPPEVTEIKHEIEVWRRTLNSMYVATREESMVHNMLQAKICTLENMMTTAIHNNKGKMTTKDFTSKLEEMKSKYIIRDMPLLFKSCLVMLVVIVMFFSHSFLPIDIHIGWIALFGAIWLLILADCRDLEGIFNRIEWSTLLFFSALFILMKALEKLGLMGWIADQTVDGVLRISEGARLAVALIVIQWVSALASSFIDNIPFTTAMIPVIIQLGQDEKVNLPLAPLVYALAFGACLGGNGTVIGASCNVVCAGIADTHGYGFTFWEFFKVGFPMLLVTNTVATCYLLICHVAIGWNS